MEKDEVRIAGCAEKDLEFSQWQMVVGAASSRDEVSCCHTVFRGWKPLPLDNSNPKLL